MKQITAVGIDVSKGRSIRKSVEPVVYRLPGERLFRHNSEDEKGRRKNSLS